MQVRLSLDLGERAEGRSGNTEGKSRDGGRVLGDKKGRNDEEKEQKRMKMLNQAIARQ
jgi:hypothetical protein